MTAPGLVGASENVETVRRLIEKAALNRLPVLLLGESGSGKEVVARAIHQASRRRSFVPIDCGALVGTLMESELFGHVKGSFSGAAENKKGLVEAAEGGTAFFDEIGDMPLEMQVKLLRLVQENEYRPVGALQWRHADIRIVAATHRDLKAAVARGEFRHDLYYRLNVFTIHVPPLRERKDDIPALIEHFQWLGKQAGLPAFEIDRTVMSAMTSYDWPGNVRELKHAIDRMAALHSEGALQVFELPSALQQHLAASSLDPSLQRLSAALDEDGAVQNFQLRPLSPVISLPEGERQIIMNALYVHHGERSRAAAALGIGRTTLYRKMKAYGLK
jgi:DNA-binding NtrC family response regulator